MTDALELLRHPLIGGDDLIEGVGDLSLDPEMIAGHPHREVPASHRLQRVKQFLRRIWLAVAEWFDLGTTPSRGGGRTEISHGISFEGIRHRIRTGARRFLTIKSCRRC